MSFAQVSDKKDFEIERFNDVLMRISLKSLDFIAIVRHDIQPMAFDEGKLYDKFISRRINKWLYDNYNPNSPVVKREYDIKDNWKEDLIKIAYEKEKEMRDVVNIAIDELVNLGIMKLMVTDTGIGGGAETAYDFTVFGEKFITFITEPVES